MMAVFVFCEKGSLVVAPEVFLTGFYYKDLKSSAKFSKKVVDELLDFSRGLELTVVYTVIEEVNGKFFNSIQVIDRGELVLSRPKIKLFTPTEEDKYFVSGSEKDLKVVETSVGVIAPIICFELRFCEIFLELSKLGAEIFTVCAQWGKARREHWKVLTSARAIETQCFLVASNGTGEMAGNSRVLDPWGRVLGEAGDSEGLIEGIINLPVFLRHYLNH
jgi:predicted amidohydrolase